MIRKLKGFVRKSILDDVSNAYYAFNQAVTELRLEERRLRRQGLTRQEIDDNIGSLEADVAFCYDEYREIRSEKWRKNAIKLSVPLPSHPHQQDATDDPTGYWEFLHTIGNWALTDKGIHHLRREIREVQKAERERWLHWVTITIAVAALIISITT